MSLDASVLSAKFAKAKQLKRKEQHSSSTKTYTMQKMPLRISMV
jgi:hypothetical protein